MDWFLYDIGLRHERVKPVSLFLSQPFLFAPFLRSKFILMLYFLASHPVTSIFLFGLLGRLSSAWCRLLQQEFFVSWKYCLIQICCWLVQKTVVRSAFFTHKLFALCHWFLFSVLRKPLFSVTSAKGVDIIFIQHHVLAYPVSFSAVLIGVHVKFSCWCHLPAVAWRNALFPRKDN